MEGWQRPTIVPGTMKRQLAAHSAFCGIDQHLMRQDDYLFPLWPKLVGLDEARASHQTNPCLAHRGCSACG